MCYLVMCWECALHCREEELQLQKRKKRKIKGNPRLSFADDVENGSEEEDAEDSKTVMKGFSMLNYF